MRWVYILISMVWLMLGVVFPVNTLESDTPPDILIVGAPCRCLWGLRADICDSELELDQLLSCREYSYILMSLGEDADLEEYQNLIPRILRTQPQARTVICSDDPDVRLLATGNQMECACCCEILTMIGDK